MLKIVFGVLWGVALGLCPSNPIVYIEGTADTIETDDGSLRLVRGCSYEFFISATFDLIANPIALLTTRNFSDQIITTSCVPNHQTKCFLNFTVPADADCVKLHSAIHPDVMERNLLSADTTDSKRSLFQHANQDFAQVEQVAYTDDSKMAKRVPHSRLLIAHACLMALSLGFFLPLGALIARYGKTRTPSWFQYHWRCQALGAIMLLVGFIIAVVKFPFPHTGLPHIHACIGFTIFGMVMWNSIWGFLRPHSNPANVHRFIWNRLHWWTGRGALVLGFLQIPLGMYLINARHAYVILYLCGVGALIGLAVLLEFSVDYRGLFTKKAMITDTPNASPNGSPILQDRRLSTTVTDPQDSASQPLRSNVIINENYPNANYPNDATNQPLRSNVINENYQNDPSNQPFRSNPTKEKFQIVPDNTVAFHQGGKPIRPVEMDSRDIYVT